MHVVVGRQQRCCPACDVEVTDRDARWCGRCGQALSTSDASDPTSDRSPRWRPVPARRVAGAVGAGLAVALAVAASGPIVDRLPTSTAVADLDVATPDADALDRVARRYVAPAPAPTEPVCLRGPARDCFRWTVADDDLGDEVVRVVGELVLHTSRGQQLVARSLHTGRVTWQVGIGRGRSLEQVVATDDLVLLTEAGGLTARDLRDGSVRWVNPELEPRGYLAGHQVEDHLLLSVERGLPPADEAEAGTGSAVLGLDAETGAVRWRVDAAGTASFGSDGTAVVNAPDGRVVALAPDGSTRWELDRGQGGGGAWASGRLVHVWSDDDGLEQLHRLRDGAPLGYTGHPLASDGRHTLVEAWAERPADTPVEATVEDGEAVVQDGGAPEVSLVLLDDDGEVWRVPARDVGCLQSAALARETVTVVTCDLVELTFDRDDGRELDRTAPSPATTSRAWVAAATLGPYLLVPEDPEAPGGGSSLVDTRTDATVARLPADAFPVARNDPSGWSIDLGGFTVVQHAGGLVAVDLDGRRPT